MFYSSHNLWYTTHHCTEALETNVGPKNAQYSDSFDHRRRIFQGQIPPNYHFLADVLPRCEMDECSQCRRRIIRGPVVTSIVTKRKTHQMAPVIGYRKQRGREGHEYVTIDYRKSQAPVMLRGIMAVCMEFGHLIDTEDGKRCICRAARNLMTGLRR